MTTAPAIQIHGDTMSVLFDCFDRQAYELFLRVKRLPEYAIACDPATMAYTVTAPARFAAMLGVELPPARDGDLPLSPFLFDDQAAIVGMALDGKRFACWSDCGLGKSLVGLEFCRHAMHRTGRRSLIVTRNEIVTQWIAESHKFYGDALPMVRLESRAQMREWCGAGTVDGQAAPPLAVTNYEKFNHRDESDQAVNELRELGCLVLDESSKLKASSGRQKWAIMHSSRGIEYKLSLTATPAPNEWVEFNDQARFLEKMKKNELCNTYFRRDEKTHRWTIKKHAIASFFLFMSDWSIYMRDPCSYGWRMDIPKPPEPEYFRHEIAMTQEQRDFVIAFNAKAPPPAGDRSGTSSMFAMDYNAISGGKLSQAAKGFVYSKGDGGARSPVPIRSLKPQFVADLAKRESVDLGLQTLIWTVYDEETKILAGLMKSMGIEAAVITGATKDKERFEILEAFVAGKVQRLISRASMLGFGLNFQCCGSMIFSGSTFSYESFYQAVRRAYRHGQEKVVRVHIPIIPELEGQMDDAIARKSDQHQKAIREMEACYVAARTARITGRHIATCSA